MLGKFGSFWLLCNYWSSSWFLLAVLGFRSWVCLLSPVFQKLLEHRTGTKQHECLWCCSQSLGRCAQKMADEHINSLSCRTAGCSCLRDSTWSGVISSCCSLSSGCGRARGTTSERVSNTLRFYLKIRSTQFHWKATRESWGHSCFPGLLSTAL